MSYSIVERRRRFYETGKRAFDFVAASIGLLILLPVLLAIALAIKMDSPGAIFYRGIRVGRHGNKFAIYKFRTMHTGAELSGTTTAKNDPRVTRLGKLLRRYKLDELPQLLNVISGEMSLVGPRPEVEEHTSAYTSEERAILTVPPGITDYSSIHFVNLSEVLGSDNPHDIFIHGGIRDQKNQLRLKYLRKRSFSEDLKIIICTLWTIVRPRRPPDTRDAVDRAKIA